MKAHRRIRRATRALALAGCATALALPSAAGARPIDYHPISPQQQAAIAAAGAVHPHGRPAAYAHNYSPPAGLGTDRQANGTPASTTVVREVRTVTSGSDHTLALVLASAALGIALLGSAYAVFRTTRIQRRVLGSNS
jgi:pantothenate kinase type III